MIVEEEDDFDAFDDEEEEEETTLRDPTRDPTSDRRTSKRLSLKGLSTIDIVDGHNRRSQSRRSSGVKKNLNWLPQPAKKG
jgi:hypothetical protein